MNMNKLTHKLKELGWRRIAFSFVTLFTLIIIVALPLASVSAQVSPHGQFATQGNYSTYHGLLKYGIMIGFTALFIVAGAAFLKKLRPENWKQYRMFLLAAFAFLGLFVYALLSHGIPLLLGRFMFDLADHRIHELAYSLILLTGGGGIATQLFKPRENAAGQLMALIPFVITLLVFILADYRGMNFTVITTFSILALLATILHPARQDFFRSFSLSQVNQAMLALIIIAAIPLATFAYTQIGLHVGTIEEQHENGEMVEEGVGGANNIGLLENINRIIFKPAMDNEEIHKEHVDDGHFGLMAGISFTIIAIGLLASLRPRGWRLAAWVAGFIPILLGLTSMVYPADSSSLGMFWGFVAIAWGIVFVAAAELTREKA